MQGKRGMKRMFQVCLAYALVASPVSVCFILTSNFFLLSWQNGFTALVSLIFFVWPWVTRKAPIPAREILAFSTLRIVLYVMIAFVMILTLAGYFVVRDKPESSVILATVALNWTMLFAVLYSALARTKPKNDGSI
jgi:membrane protease YdiL (CAAX protease family)